MALAAKLAVNDPLVTGIVVVVVDEVVFVIVADEEEEGSLLTEDRGIVHVVSGDAQSGTVALSPRSTTILVNTLPTKARMKSVWSIIWLECSMM